MEEKGQQHRLSNFPPSMIINYPESLQGNTEWHPHVFYRENLKRDTGMQKAHLFNT